MQDNACSDCPLNLLQFDQIQTRENEVKELKSFLEKIPCSVKVSGTFHGGRDSRLTCDLVVGR